MIVKQRMNYINDVLKEKYGERTLKIGIDGGFTCPNRDGSKAFGGCAFCSTRGSGEHLKSVPIHEQLESYFSSYKASRANSFILYFQNFSNTYDTIPNLKEKYEEAIVGANEIIRQKSLNKKIVGLSIATRPDCISKEVCKLLSSYQNKLDVTVELGLQTANDATKQNLNLCYTNEDFLNAVMLLQKYHIDIVAHVMVGLPFETHEDLLKTVQFLNGIPIQGIKIHSTYVVKNTKLEEMYVKGEYSPLSLESYLQEVMFIISHIRKDIVIHRISGDAPKELLVAPEWNRHKKWILNGVMNRLAKEDIWQGMEYQKTDT